MSFAHTLSFAELAVGQSASADYTVDLAVYNAFLEVSGDYSPLHVDDAFAKNAGFEGRVMHGSILNGFVSHIIGMRMPGAAALLLSVDLQFHNPVYLGDTVRVSATISQKSDAVAVVILTLSIENSTRGNLAARGSARVKVRDG